MTDDETTIRALIETWAVARDSADWERLASVWHEGGTMRATWFEGTGSDFIERSRMAWAKGVNVTHALGGSMVDVAGDRALAQTRMSITQRTSLAGQEVDVICVGRFVDFFSRRDRRWGLDARKLVYENDRIVPVVPGGPLDLDADLLARFPPGYRHLAYVQTRAGMEVAQGLPGRRGPATDALMAEARAWLADAPAA